MGWIGGKVGIKAGNLYEWALYVLIFVIGLEIGLNGRISELRDKFNAKILLMPLLTLMGSMVGGVLIGIILTIPIRWSVAIASGVGWYSLTGPVLAKYSEFYGVVGFLANFLREIFTVLFYPTIARIVGKEVAISIGGATTMDSTLPVIVKFGGRDVMIIAFVHGFILSLIVPILTPTLASLAARG